MRKLDLRKNFGFTLSYDGENLEAKDIQYRRSYSIDIDKIRSQLLNKDLTGPELFYTKYIDFDHEEIFRKKGLKINLYTINPNLAGIEFVKTRATRISSRPRILEVVNGSGIVILQKVTSHFDGKIYLSRVKRGQKVIVPPGFSLSIVNIGQTFLIVSEAHSRDDILKNVLDEMGGMAYYVIRKNAKVEIVKNPNYRNVNDFRKVNWETLIGKYNLTLKTPLVKQLLRKYDKFDWLHKDKFEIDL